MNYIGTNHFISIRAAIRYYEPYGYLSKHVKEKIRLGDISIGPPELKPGQSLKVNTEEGRYVIQEGN